MRQARKKTDKRRYRKKVSTIEKRHMKTRICKKTFEQKMRSNKEDNKKQQTGPQEEGTAERKHRRTRTNKLMKNAQEYERNRDLSSGTRSKVPEAEQKEV